MKVTPPASEKDRHLFEARLESALRQMHGGHWRVYVVHGRYGWYARAERLRNRRKGWSARRRIGSAADNTVRMSDLAQGGEYSA